MNLDMIRNSELLFKKPDIFIIYHISLFDTFQQTNQSDLYKV